MSDRSGRWFACLRSLVGGPINGGDQLKVRAGDRTRRLVVPYLMPDIDRIEDSFSGEAPPGSSVTVSVIHHVTLRRIESHEYALTGSPEGRYELDVTEDVDLRGFDIVLVSASSGRDVFQALAFVPFVAVEHANNTLLGWANARTDLRLTLRDTDGTVKATRGAGPFPFFSGAFMAALYDDEGHAAYPVGGDRLIASFAPDARLRIPRSRLEADASQDTVSGRCMPDAHYSVFVGSRVLYGKTDADGSFSRAVRYVEVGDPVSLTCLYPTGDVFGRATDAHR